MKILLQDNWEADNMTAPVKQAVRQLKWKGNDVELQYCPLGSVGYIHKSELQEFTPIGTVEFVKAFAEKVGVKLPDPIHATELLKLEGRKYATVRKKDLPLPRKTYPVFVKPLDELKKFTGFVARSEKDFELYPDVDWSNTSLFLTDVLDNIVSEWRCYVLNGKVFACVNYSGDPLRFPYKHTIEELIDVFTQPLVVAYSLDVAVINTSIPSSLNIDIGNNGHFTRVIEVNDAYALGYYGGDVELYTKMLDLRWKEITATK